MKKRFAISVLMLCALAAQGMECERTLRLPINDVLGQRADAPDAKLPLDNLWLNAIVAEAGLCVAEIGLPTNIPRRLEMLRIGDADVLSGASKTPERESYAWFTRPYRDERVYLYALQGDALVGDETLTLAEAVRRDIKFASFRSGWFGREYAEHLSEWRKNDKVLEFNNSQQAIDQLRHKRIRLLLLNEQDLQWWLSNGVSLVKLPRMIDSDPVHLMLSKQTIDAQTLQRIDEAIMRLVQRHFDPNKTATQE